jgi:hypothetical protein
MEEQRHDILKDMAAGSSRMQLKIRTTCIETMSLMRYKDHHRVAVRCLALSILASEVLEKGSNPRVLEVSQLVNTDKHHFIAKHSRLHGALRSIVDELSTTHVSTK